MQRNVSFRQPLVLLQFLIAVLLLGISATRSNAQPYTPPVNERLDINLNSNWPYRALQSATNLAGPWSIVNGAASPFTSVPAGPRQFYRVQLQ